MMRITLDTNVLVSAFISKHGHPANLLEIALTLAGIELVLSKPILAELQDVLSRQEVKARFLYTERDVNKILRTLSKSAKIQPIKSHFRVVKEDPNDNFVIGTAYDGKTDYIVSGDRHLLTLGKFRGTKIVKPRQMLKIISKRFPEIIVRL